MRFVEPFEPLRQEMQLGVSKTLSFDLGDGRQYVVQVCPGMAMALPHQMKLLLDVEPAGILRMAAVDDVDERAHPPSRLAAERDRSRGFAIDHRDLLARAQILDRVRPRGFLDPVGDAAAGAALVEAEHESRLLRRAAVDEGIDAERAMQS